MRKKLEKILEKYIKNLRKYRIFNFIIISIFSVPILSEVLIFYCCQKNIFIPYIVIYLKENTIQMLIFMIFSFIYLFHIWISKNEYYNDKNEIRVIFDFIFIVEFLVLISLSISLLLKGGIWNEIFLLLICFFMIIYVFNSIWKNLIKKSYFLFIVVIISVFMVGWISVKNFGFVSLITVIIYQLMSYDDIKYLYGKLKDNFDYNLDENKTKEEIAIKKFYLNILILFLYIYIVLTQDAKISQRIYEYIESKKLSEIESIFFRGYDRIMIISIVILIYAIILVLKKKSIKEEMIKFKQKFEDNLIKFLQKYIIRTK